MLREQVRLLSNSAVFLLGTKESVAKQGLKKSQDRLTRQSTASSWETSVVFTIPHQHGANS